MSEYLLLKWGSIKALDIPNSNAAAVTAYEAYASLGTRAGGARPDGHIEALCALVDALEDDAYIVNDWSGDEYTKEQAKAYLRGYGG